MSVARGVAPLAAALIALALARAARGQTPGAAFDHARHRRVVPTCATCHAGAAQPDASLWPDPASCAVCHDGAIRRRLAWQPPAAARRSNLRFTHARHAAAATRRAARDTTQRPSSCLDCHTDLGAPAVVRRAAVGRCLSCHGVQVRHLSAPDSACATCHLSLAEARALTREDVARFPAPDRHKEAGFLARGGHGAAAGPAAASCATCHSRDFCLGCHVDAPEQPAIQALPSDPRSLAIAVRLAAPPSHAQPSFATRHGGAVGRDAGACATCHTRESCVACHTTPPRVAAHLASGGPGRSAGAVVSRHPPPSHVGGFADRHAGQASAAAGSCAGCHARADCLACHRPQGGRGAGYHPAGFLARHPAAAYSREISCSDCHNTAGFCAACHATAGLTARRALGSGYHDATPFFIAGHGAAARRSLETCVGCHAERDCLACHSALGGRRFNPHGPGFDAERLKRRNPEVCTACHGTSIP